MPPGFGPTRHLDSDTFTQSGAPKSELAWRDASLPHCLGKQPLHRDKHESKARA